MSNAKRQGKITALETLGLVDGPGRRLVLFMAGCNLRCQYCHNPETWDPQGFTQTLTAAQVLHLYQRYQNYYGKQGGVTFSGGEPLLQPEFLVETLTLLREHGIHTALDTAGAVADGYEQVLDLIDLVILDVKAVDPTEYQKLTGQPINNFQRFLQAVTAKHKPLWLRQVIVPGMNDDAPHLEQLRAFVAQVPNVQKIELLPYHVMARDKYAQLNLPYRLSGVPAMNPERCRQLEKKLRFDLFNHD